MVIVEGPNKVDLDNYIEHLHDCGHIDESDKPRLKRHVNYALVETARDTLELAAKLVCPLCHSGQKVYHETPQGKYFHPAGEFGELENPCEAQAIWQERNKPNGV